VNPFDRIQADPRVAALAAQLAEGRGPAWAEGVWGSAGPIIATIAADQLARPVLLVTAHSDEADDARDDVETATGRAPDLLPQIEALPGEQTGDEEIAAERLRLCLDLCDYTAARGRRPAPRIVASIFALMHPVPSPAALARHSRRVAVGETLNLDEFVAWLTGQRMTRCDQVEAPGDFALRGGILDVFAFGRGEPVRIELFGDTIESIRLFDAGTQRSAQPLDAVRLPVLPSRGAPPAADETTGFFALLPPETLVVFIEPTEAQELGRSYWQRLGERGGMIPADAVFRRAADFAQLFVQRFVGGAERSVNFEISTLPPFDPRPAEAIESLRQMAVESDVFVMCDNAAEAQRFGELLVEAPQRSARIRTHVGVLRRGFQWPGAAYVPHHEIFRRTRQRRTLRRVQPARPIDDFFDLSAGDHVVHAAHGIGRFRGLKTIEREGTSDEYLLIEFADSATIHVPTSQIHVVQKYIGSRGGRPKLSKLGGAAWKRARQKAEESVSDLAAELLALQAQRSMHEGISYPQDTLWQREFEGAFLFTETEDQLRALAEIKGDMYRPRPMDRLLCGDVGFGKTELAIRAAFKAIEYGRQVAVLVPTTVLAEQHFTTFRERLADYPFTVEVLSRFRTRGEQMKILERARKGAIDILIGTHRILSNDVRFADLGLVVIDEEQRFGVDAKEKLKRLRTTVDVLTLSATPIPRTLHLAMMGVRDISSLATPPVDRRAIVTQVRMWDDALIRDAIRRELARDGQIYFVHNLVRDIQSVAARVQSLVPEARVVVGHGQMNAHELEDVMLKFMRREADVLVSTTIIESGIDIPSANTIFLNRADRFGLAELHQLRGRVGRSKHRAYCYLVLSPKHPVKEVAARRLKAIEQYSDLGAGFQIAMRDLEIRGAGNILGAEQSGHIEAVGYEMYCQLLDQAVARTKNERRDEYRPVNLDIGLKATLPRAYIRGEKQRMDVYRRLAVGRSPADLETLASDMRDAFGPLPAEVETLLRLATVRVLAAPHGIRSIVLDPPDVVFSVEDMERASALFQTGPGSPRVPDGKTIHWRLPKRLLEPQSVLELLLQQLTSAAPSPPQSAPEYETAGSAGHSARP